MSVITDTFNRCANEGRRALIPYFMAGYPSEKSFCELIKSSFEIGADIIEIGIPFSDPVADGPVIQIASQAALQSGVNVPKVFAMLRSLALNDDQPLVIMSYLNPILQYGLDAFLANARKCGVRGLIVPDIVIEESETLEKACENHGIDLVHLLAPTSPPNRQEAILERTSGFVYLVSVAGVTGGNLRLSDELSGRVSSIRGQSQIPVAVGFGISSPEIAAEVSRIADGVIVGSALLDRLNSDEPVSERVRKATAFLRDLREATKLTYTPGTPIERR